MQCQMILRPCVPIISLQITYIILIRIKKLNLLLPKLFRLDSKVLARVVQIVHVSDAVKHGLKRVMI